MKKPRKYPIALNLPQVVALLIIYGRHVVEMMTKNAALLPNPDPDLNTVSQHLDDLDASETTARTRAKGAAAVRNDKRKVVEDDLGLLKTFVGRCVSKNPALAITLILAAGMTPKGYTAPFKANLAATMGNPQQAILRARAAKGRVVYEWQMSGDGGHTWLPVASTSEANASAEGLTVGSTYQFRFRTIRKRVPSDWSDPVSLLIRR